MAMKLMASLVLVRQWKTIAIHAKFQIAVKYSAMASKNLAIC